MLQCRTDDDDEQLKIELLSQWKLEAEFRNYNSSLFMLGDEGRRGRYIEALSNGEPKPIFSFCSHRECIV